MRQMFVRLALVATLAATHPAFAEVLCRRPSGLLVMRPQSCKGREWPVDSLAVGLQGPPGEQGPPGAQGPPGPGQTLDIQPVINQRSAGPGLAQTDATCAAGYALTGGGAVTGDGASQLIDSWPNASQVNTWSVIYYNPPAGAINVAYALCARLR
jgi:hypothetical protein